MTAGYFLYNICILSLAGTGTSASFTAAAAASAAEIPFNLIQGFLGLFICMGLYPLFVKGLTRAHLSVR